MKGKGEKVKKSPRIEVKEGPEYKAVYASGVFGGLDPNDGRIIFFLDRIKPKMKSNPRGAMGLDRIDRELQIEVHMSPPQFMSIARWMMDHAKRFEQKMKSGKKKAPESSGTSYIG